MKVADFRVVRSVIRKFYHNLNQNTCREWAIKSGRFLNQNAKLEKGDNYNVGLELLPGDLCGPNICGCNGSCLRTCLVFSGKGNRVHQERLLVDHKITPVLGARAKRTWLYHNDKKFFYRILETELAKSKLTAEVLDKPMAVRLNVFSDIDWRKFIAKHPDIQFYDYTKHWNREGLPNYHLTYSCSEKVSLKQIHAKLTAWYNVAKVFPRDMPETYLGYPVVDGDTSDNRYDDARGVVVGLKWKQPVGKKLKQKTKFLEV